MTNRELYNLNKLTLVCNNTGGFIYYTSDDKVPMLMVKMLFGSSLSKIYEQVEAWLDEDITDSVLYLYNVEEI